MRSDHYITAGTSYTDLAFQVFALIPLSEDKTCEEGTLHNLMLCWESMGHLCSSTRHYPGRPPGEGMAAPPGSWPGESHGQRHLAGYSPQDHTESDTTEAT